jgi:hypothetical protein
MLESMAEAGRTPAALENRPEVMEYLAPYVTAFFKLSDRRTIGFAAPNPISFSDIRAYLDIFPIGDIELFLHLMTEMDAEYLSVKTKKTTTSGGQGKTVKG